MSQLKLVQNIDLAGNVNGRLGELGEDFLTAIAGVSITLLTLGYRSVIIVMLSIPLSLSTGIVLINILGYNLNQMSIVGFVVSLGLLVDGLIVVVKNIERLLREKLEAVLRGAKQIAFAVLGCAITACSR